MVMQPRQVRMDLKMSARGGPVTFAGGSYFVGSRSKQSVGPEVTINMNSHPPILDTSPPKPSSSLSGGPTRGGGQLLDCFRSVCNFVMSTSQTPVTWVDPGYINQFHPSLMTGSYFPETPYPMLGTNTGNQNVPVWYAANPGSNMEFQEPIQSLFHQSELTPHCNDIPNHRNISKCSKPLNPEAKEWVPRNFQDKKSSTVSSNSTCSHLSKNLLLSPVVIPTSMAEFHILDRIEVSNNNNGISAQEVSNNKNTRANVEAIKNIKNEVQSKVWDKVSQTSDIECSMSQMDNLDDKKPKVKREKDDLNLSFEGEAKLHALNQNQDNSTLSYACITRKSPEPLNCGVDVDAEKNLKLPRIFTKDKKYPKEKAVSLLENKKKELLPFRTATKHQKNNTKKFLNELKEHSPVKNSLTESYSEELVPDIVSRTSGISPSSSLESSSNMLPHEEISHCTSTPLVKSGNLRRTTSESSGSSRSRTMSESSTGSLDIEFEECDDPVESVSVGEKSTSRHPNSIIALICGMDSDSEESDGNESDDDWDTLDCENLVLDDSWETFGLMNLTPNIVIPHCSKDSVDKGQVESVCDNDDSFASSIDLDKINKQWEKEIKLNVIPSSPNRVSFGKVVIHPMVTWSHAYRSARRGPWEQHARDRARFGSRIATVERVLAPVLEKDHREAIYHKIYG